MQKLISSQHVLIAPVKILLIPANMTILLRILQLWVTLYAFQYLMRSLTALGRDDLSIILGKL